MFEINKRIRLKFIRLVDRYYYKEPVLDDKEYDAVYYFFCETPYENSAPFITLYIDLTKTPEEILESFKKNYRQVIRKVIREDLFDYQFVDNPTEEDIETYVTNFNRFSKLKGIYSADKNLLLDLQRESRLAFARIVMDDEAICAFAFIIEGSKVTSQYEWNARFWVDKEKEPDKYRYVGFSNRALEYFSMLHFKEKGFTTYDLGGLTLDEGDEDLSNIDKRKLGYGGEIVKVYNYILPLNWKGKLFLLIKKILGR